MNNCVLAVFLIIFPSTIILSFIFTKKVGVLIFLPLTETFHKEISFSACLLEQTPDSAIVLAILCVGSMFVIIN